MEMISSGLKINGLRAADCLDARRRRSIDKKMCRGVNKLMCTV